MTESSITVSGSARLSASRQRNFLLLQGPIGGFFALLAQRLGAAGHGVHRILFNGGDRLFWRGMALDFRGTERQWPEFLGAKLSDLGITDVVLFGDCRPLHRAAIRVAESRGIAVHVFEEGYLRPNWLTLEAGGVNRHSPLAREAAWYLEAARELPSWSPGIALSNSFRRRAAEDVLYNLASLLFAPRYPGYRTHKPWHPLREYRAGARRFFGKPAARRRSALAVSRLTAGTQPYYVFPLQLEADAQIRFHSPYGSMVPAIRAVIESFARCAPADALLVATEHPLDSGVFDLGEVTGDCAQAAGVAGRVCFLEGGSPEPLLQHSRGVVTVNSTVGIPALGFGLPVKTLGHAIYDLPGLVHQGTLDQFWCGAAAPDPVLFDCFRRVVAARTQINGALYSAQGLLLAADAAARRLSAAVPSPTAVTSRSRATAASPAEFAPELHAEVLR